MHHRDRAVRGSCGWIAGVALAIAAAHAQAPQDPLAEYRALTKETDGLAVYNELLEGQIQEQQSELEALALAIEQVPDLERQIPPLLSRMIAGLEQFVALDLPFLPEERNERVMELRALLGRTDVTIAEKLRRVLEAFQIENEYGRTIEAYVGRVEVDGIAREGEFLRVGRIALLFQTPDLQYTGAWDQHTGSWIELGGGQRNSVRQGLRMARAQAAPDLIMLPVSAPVEE